MDPRRALPWVLAAAFAGLAAWALVRRDAATTTGDGRDAEVARLLQRVEDLERRLAERPPPLLAVAPKGGEEKPAPKPQKRGPRAEAEKAPETAPQAVPPEGQRITITPEMVARLFRDGDPQTSVPATPVPAPDELRRTLESTTGPAHEAALQALAGAHSAAYLPLLVDTVNARETPSNVRSLIDRIANLKDRPWSALQATGAPDTPIDGDLGTAWAARRPEMGEVTLDLTYAHAVRVDEVRVHETLSAGALARVQAKAPDGTWETIWEGVALREASPRWFEPPVSRTGYATNALRLVVDTDRVPGWDEIDAVELVGDGTRQWASEAKASSSYADGGQ